MKKFWILYNHHCMYEHLQRSNNAILVSMLFKVNANNWNGYNGKFIFSMEKKIKIERWNFTFKF